jgi:hypothetical protein
VNETLEYGKISLAVGRKTNGIDWKLEPMVLAGSLFNVERWIRAAARMTAAGEFAMPRGFSGSFAAGGILTRFPVPDPEKFFVKSPLVWGIDCLSAKKVRFGIHPAGSDFFGAVTVKKKVTVGGFVDVSPFANAGVSLLSKSLTPGTEEAKRVYSLSVGALVSLQWGRNVVDLGLSLPIARSSEAGVTRIELLVDQPSLL